MLEIGATHLVVTRSQRVHAERGAALRCAPGADPGPAIRVETRCFDRLARPSLPMCSEFCFGTNSGATPMPAMRPRRCLHIT